MYAAEDMLTAKGKQNDVQQLLYACQKELKRMSCPYKDLDQIRKNMLAETAELIEQVSVMQLTGV